MTHQNNIHPFDEAVALKTVSVDLFQGYFPPQLYGNMVGPFGGVISAAILNAILSHRDRLGDPISITVNYTGPIADAPFDIKLRLIRTNRTNQHWFAELTQEGEIAVTATAVLGSRRDAWSDTELEFPKATRPEEVAPFESMPTPPWVSRYEYRFIRGFLTFSGKPSPSSDSLLWVKDVPDRPLDFLSLAAITDVFFPRVFFRLQNRFPAGTISITSYFHADKDALEKQESRPVLARARGQRFYRGYFDQVAEIWSDKGEMLASSSQIVYYNN